MALRAYLDRTPVLGPGAWVDPAALVIGDVTLGAESSVWPMTVIRGDVNHIRIGDRSNVQDGSILHVSRPSPGRHDGWPLVVGDDVTIGHQVVIHGCTIGHRCLVGIGAIVLDGAVVEDEVMIGAGSVVTPRQAARVARALRRQPGTPRARAHGGGNRALRHGRAPLRGPAARVRWSLAHWCRVAGSQLATRAAKWRGSSPPFGPGAPWAGTTIEGRCRAEEVAPHVVRARTASSAVSRNCRGVMTWEWSATSTCQARVLSAPRGTRSKRRLVSAAASVATRRCG